MDNRKLEEIIEQAYKEEIDFAERLKRLAIEVKSKITHLERSPVIASTLLINSAIKTYDAIIFLAKKGYGQQALILVRSILESAIDFQYILNDPKNRSSQYLEYAKKERYDLIAALKRMHGENTIQKLFNEGVLENIRRDYENLPFDFSDRKYNYSWSGKSIKQMARETGFESHYDVLYRILCYHTHSTPSGVISGVKPHIEEVKVDISYGPSRELIGEVFLYSYGPFIRIIGKYNDLHNLGCDNYIEIVIKGHEKLRTQNLSK